MCSLWSGVWCVLLVKARGYVCGVEGVIGVGWDVVEVEEGE